MSISMCLYKNIGQDVLLKQEQPTLPVGTRFILTNRFNKAENGSWEIVNNKQAPVYSCVKVLKEGKLSKRKVDHKTFLETTIYSSLYEK